MSPHDRARLQHLTDALDAATRFARGRERTDLDSDEMLLFALVRAIEIAGEAASRITIETRAELPDVPWASFIGIRNRLVHAYFDINRDIPWTTVTEATPPLAQRLKNLLEGMRLARAAVRLALLVNLLRNALRKSVRAFRKALHPTLIGIGQLNRPPGRSLRRDRRLLSRLLFLRNARHQRSKGIVQVKRAGMASLLKRDASQLSRGRVLGCHPRPRLAAVRLAERRGPTRSSDIPLGLLVELAARMETLGTDSPDVAF